MRQTVNSVYRFSAKLEIRAELHWIAGLALHKISYKKLLHGFDLSSFHLEDYMLHFVYGLSVVRPLNYYLEAV